MTILLKKENKPLTKAEANKQFGLLYQQNQLLLNQVRVLTKKLERISIE